MPQYKTGTVTLTNGSPVVTGSGTLWLANAISGNSFTARDETTSYDIQSVDTNLQITLSTNYAGTGGAGLDYSITKDFTTNLELPEIWNGDKDWPWHVTQAFRKIDQYLGGGAVLPFTPEFYGLKLDDRDGTAVGDVLLINRDQTFLARNATDAAYAGMVALTYNGLTLTSNATGFSVAGGTASKTLTVELDSLVNQDLTTDAGPTFAHAHLTDAIADNTSTTQAATTAFAKSQDAVLCNPKAMAQGVAMTAATGITTGQAGIFVVNNAHTDFGTGNFTFVFHGSAGTEEVLFSSYEDESNYYYLYVTAANKIQFRAVTADVVLAVDSVIALPSLVNDVHEITIVITRETTVTHGSMLVYTDAVLLDTVDIGETATPINIAPAGTLQILGHITTRYAGTIHQALTYNRALTAAKVLDLYRNGIAESDKCGSQTNLVDAAASIFTSGTYAWAAWGGNTLANVGNQLTITYVDNVLGGYNLLGNAGDLTADLVVGKKYRLVIDAKYAGGATVPLLCQGPVGGTAPSIGVLTTNLTTYIWEFTAEAENYIVVRGMAASNVVTIDNWYLYEIGATLALESKNIGSGVWLDSSSNNLHATMPTTGWSLTQSLKNQPVLTNLLTNTQWIANSGSTLENVGDQLLTDPTFDVAGSWTKTDAAVTVTGGKAVFTNCGASNEVFQTVTGLVVGKLYKVVATCSDYTDGTYAAAADNPTTIFGNIISSTTTSTLVFEAVATSCAIGIFCITIGGDASFSDLTLYEVTPGYVAADTLAPDGWSKDTTGAGMDVFREHSGTYTKNGSFYALKIVAGAGASTLVFITNDSPVWLDKMKGRTITFGAWVYASVASSARLVIRTGSATYWYSAHHSGNSTYEWLELTLAVPIAATYVRPYIDIGVNNTAYFSQPMLVFGSSIGQGNYQPIPNEVIWLQTPASIASLVSTGYSDTAATTVNLEVATSGQIGKGIKAINVRGAANDSGSAGADTYLALDDGTGAGAGYVVNIGGLANDRSNFAPAGWQKCNDNGDVRYIIEASGSGTFDIQTLNINAIQTQ